MLRELLGVLQQQHENAHAMNVEWIVLFLLFYFIIRLFNVILYYIILKTIIWNKSKLHLRNIM